LIDRFGRGSGVHRRRAGRDRLASFRGRLARSIHLAAIITGLGASPIFGATVGNALKWFPDRRGLAAGLNVRRLRRGARSPLCLSPP